jgi:CheY-like chemotaxis protein
MKRKEGSILVVESNPKDQAVIKTAFEDIGVRDKVYVVDDGDEAIAFLKGVGKYSDRKEFLFPTFLLTDLEMDRVNGFELLLFLKRSRLIIIPTIVFSRSCDLDDIGRAYSFGANAFHTKPASMGGLCLLLKTICDYWSCVELPELDESGNLKHADESGNLSEKLRHPLTVDPESGALGKSAVG